METTVKERLIQFINYKGLTINKFEKTCGLSTGYIANMRVSIQPSKVRSIAQNFPDLNMGWLLTGEGTMLKDATPDFCLMPPSAPSYEDIIKEKERIITEQASHIDSLKRSLNMNEKVIELMSETLKQSIVGDGATRNKAV